MTADGFAWLVPRSWRKNSLPAWKSWDQKGDVGFLDMQFLATKALCVSACVSGTGIVSPCPLPGWEGWAFLEVWVTSRAAPRCYPAAQGRAVLISGCTDPKPAAWCAACAWNANAASASPQRHSHGADVLERLDNGNGWGRGVVSVSLTKIGAVNPVSLQRTAGWLTTQNAAVVGGGEGGFGCPLPFSLPFRHPNAGEMTGASQHPMQHLTWDSASSVGAWKSLAPSWPGKEKDAGVLPLVL